MNSDLSMSEIKKINRQHIIFNIFKQHTRLSKYEMKKISHFSMSSVITTIDELLQIGYIKQCGIGESTGGRPPVYYCINDLGGYAVGIDFNSEAIYVTLINLKSNVIDTISKRFGSPERDINSIIEQAISLIKELISAHGVEDRILCIGIAAPGLVDAEKGIILYYAYPYNGKNVPIKDIFSQYFNYPIFVDKSINSITYAYKEKSETDLDNMILISIRTGIGMGCILNGSIYRGYSGIAGEIGHIRVFPSTTQCSCGKIGCLEAEASIYAIANKMDILLQKNPTYQKMITDSSSAKIDIFIKLVQSKNPEALRLLDEICYYLATVSAQLVNILNPKRIVFFGELTQCGEIFLQDIKNYIYKDSFSMSAEHLSISVSDLLPSAGSQGAGAYALSNYFLPIDIAKLVLNKNNQNH